MPQRPGAVLAARRGAVAGAGQRRHVAGPRDLDEDGRAVGQRGAGGAPGQARQPGRPGGRIAFELEVVAGRR